MIAGERPRRLTVDPDVDAMRRLYPSEIPPAVNNLKGSPSVRIVLSDQLPPEIKKAAGTLALSLGLKNYQFVAEREVGPHQLIEHDFLLIGQPGQQTLLPRLPDQVRIQSGAFTLNNARYNEPTDAFFGVFHHPHNDNRVAALFIPSSKKFADIVARKITHYGKYSYLAFKSGENKDKGVWSIEKSPLVHKWD
jgi:hypothetical protein